MTSDKIVTTKKVDVQQLPLGLHWPAQQRFETFVAGDNGVSVAFVKHISEGADTSWAFLAGPSGSGKTHLLMAACAQFSAAGGSAQYLALGTLDQSPADVLRGFGGSTLLCLDDVDAIAGNANTEHALFDLYNRCRAENSTLIFSAKTVPSKLGLVLPDLLSRLSSCALATLKPLSEDDRREALRQRALERGLILDTAALDYLFTRQARDLNTLTALLNRLDRASLAAQRRVTVPFLRQLLEP